jgi:hypothetical protein
VPPCVRFERWHLGGIFVKPLLVAFYFIPSVFGSSNEQNLLIPIFKTIALTVKTGI